MRKAKVTKKLQDDEGIMHACIAIQYSYIRTTHTKVTFY